MTTTATHNGHDTTPERVLFVAFELSDKTWKLGFTTGHGREQGDAGGNFKTPLEWLVLYICHSNPEKPPYARQTATRLCNDKGDEETVTDVITLNKHHQRIEHLGLTLAESKQLLVTVQIVKP